MQVDTMVVMRVAIPRMKYLEPSMKVEIDGKNMVFHAFMKITVK